MERYGVKLETEVEEIMKTACHIRYRDILRFERAETMVRLSNDA